MMPEIANVDAENSDREEAPIKHNSSIVEIGGVPSFAIETHEPGDDIYISRHIIEHGSWEPFETEIT
jgi:hypothetical protein